MQAAFDESAKSSSRNCHSWIWPDPWATRRLLAAFRSWYGSEKYPCLHVNAIGRVGFNIAFWRDSKLFFYFFRIEFSSAFPLISLSQGPYPRSIASHRHSHAGRSSREPCRRPLPTWICRRVGTSAREAEGSVTESAKTGWVRCWLNKKKGRNWKWSQITFKYHIKIFFLPFDLKRIL